MSEVFVDNSSPFSPFTLYIPGINFIHFVTFLVPKKSKNVIAAGQGIITSLLFIPGIYFFSEYDSILLVLVYVSIVGISRVKERPFYKIPVIYEIYWLISLVTFGLISSAGTAKNKSAEIREETIRVQP